MSSLAWGVEGQAAALPAPPDLALHSSLGTGASKNLTRPATREASLPTSPQLLFFFFLWFDIYTLTQLLFIIRRGIPFQLTSARPAVGQALDAGL